MSADNYYKVGGSLEYQHPTYVVRKADAELYEGLKNGEFCYVLNSRQMGKSSLRVQMMKQLKAQGFKCASIDMTRIGSHVTSAEWYAGLVSELLRGFSLSRKVDFSTWWRQRDLLPPLQRLRELIEDVLLVEFSQNLVIFIDEIDSIIKIPFKEDFFAFIRACYNQRVDNPEYNRLTFCLLGVAAPSDLIAERNFSTPFNIGRAIELTGFQLHEATPLAQGLAGKTSNPQAVLSEVLSWTGGQPFLTQKICRLILNAEEPIPAEGEAAWIENLVRKQIIENWETQDEPEHLRTIRDRVLWSERKTQLIQLYGQILQTGEVKANDKPEQLELRLSGLVVKQPGRGEVSSPVLRIYNRIYASVFNQAWIDEVSAEAGLTAEGAETSADSKTEIQVIEQVALNALQKFESQQIEGLILAMTAGQALKTLVKDGGSLQEYPTVRPLSALQTILERICECNQFKSHQGCLSDVSFSPDGQQIVTTGEDGTARLWTFSGEPLAQFNGHQGSINSVSFSPDGQQIATAGRDGTARLWNLFGQQLLELKGHYGKVQSVSFSPDGQIIITAGDDGIARLWNLSGQQIAQLKTRLGRVISVCFSPDGQYIATVGESTIVKIWHLSGNLATQLKGHLDWVWDISFSPNGQYLATASADGTAKIWNLFTQESVTCIGHQGWVGSVEFSPDGQHLATTGEDGIIRFWKLSGHKLTQLKGHEGWVWSASFSPDGQYLVSAGVDGIARLWDLLEKPLLQWNSHHGRVRSLSFSPDGQRLATAEADSVQLWNLQGKQLTQFHGHQDRVARVRFSPDGQYLATAGDDGTVILWNHEKQQIIFNSHQGRVNSISFSPDGQYLATAGDDSMVRLWNLQGKQLSQFNAHQGRLDVVDVSPDGQCLATAGADGTVRLWQRSGQQVLEFKDHQGWVYSLSFSPNGQYLATGGTGGIVRLWNLSGHELAQWQSHRTIVYCVRFHPDGQQIATAGADGMAKLWDLSGRQLAQWQSPKGSVYSTVSFSPDGRYLATAGTGGLQLWRMGGLDELLTQGCDWLKNYFVTHPEALEKLEVCQNRVNSTEVGGNSERTAEVKARLARSQKTSESAPALNSTPRAGMGRLAAKSLESEKFRDIRGLARVLTGNIAGAIEDFQASLEWTDNEEKRLQRQSWINALRAGKNPFAEEEIESLFEEYLHPHPETLPELQLRQNQLNSTEAFRNLSISGDVEDEIPNRVSSASNVSNRLRSESRIDYAWLRCLLAAGRWQEADQETASIILKICGREADGWLTEKEIKKIPCEDLVTIDQLWMQYSGGRFGFSVQMRIYNECKKSYRVFMERVGWRVQYYWKDYSNLTFSLEAPQGHLPLWQELFGGLGGWFDWTWVSSLISRIENCNKANENQTTATDIESFMTNSADSTSAVRDDLSSECEVDYTQLRDLLAAGKWQEADQETTAVMLRISGREAKGWLRDKDIEKFPCTDLLTIDQLWMCHSKGRFGFSVQKEIWESVGGTNNATIEIYQSFCERVGWRNRDSYWLFYPNLTFTTKAPAGHLPGGQNANGLFVLVWWHIISTLASRLTECKIQASVSC